MSNSRKGRLFFLKTEKEIRSEGIFSDFVSFGLVLLLIGMQN